MSLTEQPTITDAIAPCVRIQVVAVKLPGEWIIRAIAAFAPAERLIATLRPYVALAPQEALEWTQHDYRVPAYLIYGSGDIRAWDWPVAGVYLFSHAGGDNYDNARRLA